MMTRRDFLKAGAVATGVAAVGGSAAVVLREVSSMPEDPQAAWNSAEGVDRLLLAATLAPSSHNTQPWRFRVSDEAIEVLGDPNRTMGKADPRLRELHVSLGCAVENVAIAAAEAGTPVSVGLVPGLAGQHRAELRFGGAGESRTYPRLAAAIPRRRTNRSPYDPDRSVSDATLAKLGDLTSGDVRIIWLTSDTDRMQFTNLSVEATRAHVADAAIQRDSHRWYRMTSDEAQSYRDGVTVRGSNLPSLASVLLGLVPPSPASFDDAWAKTTKETHCGTAPAFGLLVAKRASDRAAWVQAGRSYQRMQLAATLDGVALHPISQALALRDREVATGDPGRFSAGLEGLGGKGEVVLAFRLGYPTRAQAPSLRRTAVVERA
jgi:hypothetical protein